MSEGPAIESLLHHLADCPRAFLEPPRLEGRDGVHVDAVVHDLILMLGGAPLPDSSFASFQGKTKQEAKRLRLILVACWLFYHPYFRESASQAGATLALLMTGLDALAGLVTADQCVQDPDRREELARRCLHALDILPAEESVERAADRLTALDSVERDALVKATRAKQRRARELRKRMEKNKAREAAAKASREW